MNPPLCLVCDGQLRPYPRLPGLLKCSTCGFVTADVSLSDAGLAALYGSAYFHGEEYSDYLADRRTIQRNFRRRLEVLLPHVNAPRTKRLFEVGSAYGLFLEVAREQFAEVSGIDISEAASAYARDELGLNVSAGDLLDYPLQRPVDVACMWDTIEHLRSPHLYIEKLSKVTPPGGVIAISTGDVESFMARLQGQRWRQIHPPTHLHYFSVATLSRLLERYGYTVRYAKSEGMWRSLDMIAGILLKVRGNNPGLYDLLKRTGILKLDLYLNLGDIMFLIAEKTPRAGID
jgi:SAM-dependent methyltransferase